MPRVTRYLIANLAGALLLLFAAVGLVTTAFLAHVLAGSAVLTVAAAGAGLYLARVTPPVSPYAGESR